MRSFAISLAVLALAQLPPPPHPDLGVSGWGHYVNEAAGNPVGGREQGGADTGDESARFEVTYSLYSGWPRT